MNTTTTNPLIEILPRGPSIAGTRITVYSMMDYIKANSIEGRFWDPGGEIRAKLQEGLSLLSARPPNWDAILANGESVGYQLAEEVDRARRDAFQIEHVTKFAFGPRKIGTVAIETFRLKNRPYISGHAALFIGRNFWRRTPPARGKNKDESQRCGRRKTHRRWNIQQEAK